MRLWLFEAKLLSRRNGSNPQSPKLYSKKLIQTSRCKTFSPRYCHPHKPSYSSLKCGANNFWWLMTSARLPSSLERWRNMQMKLYRKHWCLHLSLSCSEAICIENIFYDAIKKIAPLIPTSMFTTAFNLLPIEITLLALRLARKNLLALGLWRLHQRAACKRHRRAINASFGQ